MSIAGASGWREVKPGAFQLIVHKTNAVAFAMDSAQDVYDQTGAGGWVETWNFTITHKDRDTLYVFWTRSVNNYLMTADKPGSRFFFAAFGEMKRAP